VSSSASEGAVPSKGAMPSSPRAGVQQRGVGGGENERGVGILLRGAEQLDGRRRRPSISPLATNGV
jgi:hypothetical protein